MNKDKTTVENIRIFFLFLKNIVQNSYMVKTMVVRDLNSRYSGSLLGIFWSVIHLKFFAHLVIVLTSSVAVPQQTPVI